MRALREQPRVTAAKVLGAICLVLIGTAIGFALDRGGRDETRAMQVRLTSAQQSARDQRSQVRSTGVELRRATAAQARAERSLTDARRVNARLRRELKAAKRSRRKTKRRK